MEAKFYTTNQNIVVQEPLSVLVVQVDEFILQAAYEFLRSTPSVVAPSLGSSVATSFALRLPTNRGENENAFFSPFNEAAKRVPCPKSGNIGKGCS